MFTRTYEDQTLLVCFNLSDTEHQIKMKKFNSIIEKKGHKLPTGVISNEQITLPAFGCFYGEIS